MVRYVVRRLVYMVPVLLGTTFLIFLAVYALPGDPVQAIAGPGQAVAPAVRAAIVAKYHLDDPLLQQYLAYMGRLLTGDFGTDLNGKSVGALIAASWPVTVKLGLTAWVLGGLLGVLLGTLAGIRSGGFLDTSVLAGTTLVLGVPYFVTAYVAKYVFAVKLGWLPPSGVSDGWPLSYVLPAVCLAIFLVPEIARLTRASVLGNLQSDYVDTAIAKGLGRRTIVVRHVLRNSLLPVVSVLGLSLGYLISGSVLIEGIFNMPGLGFAVFRGIAQHNGATVVGIGTLLILVFLLLNLLVDLLYGILDPRIRLV
ncbi:ABC transporter permease [Nakamurella lactea]|uniref:ABC transporter permease n=1 Tax=Nakamurella lactea TaxID=459515 RepID=UPI00040B3386|nr:ABC transporter permease [Nakamurella lactea]